MLNSIPTMLLMSNCNKSEVTLLVNTTVMIMTPPIECATFICQRFFNGKNGFLFTCTEEHTRIYCVEAERHRK